MRLPVTIIIMAFCFNALAQEPNEVVELLRTDLRNDREAIILEALALTDSQYVAFRPIFDAYTQEQRDLWTARLALIDDHAHAREDLSDAQASKFIDRLLAIDMKDLELRSKYTKQMRKVLPATKVARWIQLERRLGQLLEIQAANEVIQRPAKH